MLLATPTAPLHELGAWLHQARNDLDAALNVVPPQPSPDEVPLDIAAVSAAAQSIEECTAVLSKALRFLHNLLDTADSKSSEGDALAENESSLSTGIYAEPPHGSPDDSEEYITEGDDDGDGDDDDEDDGDDGDEMDDDEIDLPEIDPVYGDDAAELNGVVIARIQAALGDDASFDAFKDQAMEFGTGKQPAESFYTYLETHMTDAMIAEFILDFARLLANVDQRTTLLAAHCRAVRRKAKDAAATAASSSKPPSPPPPLRRNLSMASSINDDTSPRDDDSFEYPSESIEWHEELHEPTGVDAVFDIICPEGSQGYYYYIRQFNKDTFMDILYYLSPGYGQIVVNSVTDQLNSKYKVFMDEHPGWNGQISIFAHSLGTVITYDILTHPAHSVAKNGVKFSGLDFSIENFFAAGYYYNESIVALDRSPVPVMILSRGGLDLKDGKFTPGITMPSCNHYYNIFHPIDPIAYRVEPLIHPDMHDKPPVPLIQCKHMPFSKMQEMWERITAPVPGFTLPRIDYVMRRRGREGVIEMAYAAASHSACWDSDDVVMFTLMQICRPVVDKLRRYMSAQRPLPSLYPRGLVPITPHSKIRIATTVLARDRATGAWGTRTAVMDHKRIYFASNADNIGCRKKWSIPLSAKLGVQLGDDAFTLKVTPDEATPGLAGGSGRNLRFGIGGSAPHTPSSTTSAAAAATCTQILRASTTELRNEWLEALTHAIHLLTLPPIPAGTSLPSSSSSSICTVGLDLPSGACVDYFGAVKTSLLQFKTLKAKSWYESQGWTSRWFVLTKSSLDCYDTCPNLVGLAQFPVHKSTVLAYPKRCLLRIVTKTGTTLDFKVKDSRTFDVWTHGLEAVDRCHVRLHEDVVDHSALGVSLDSQLPSVHRLSVDKYFVLNDDKGPYAAFQIRIIHTGGQTILRRFSAFREVNRQLRLIFPHEQMPPLPSTRLWGKFDPAYLAAKSTHLNTYLGKVEAMCTNNPAANTILQQFLNVDTASPSYGDE
ncbi:hypothetical protein DYB37_002473 [Aphanomyces astaci]|uniref:DDHD domain-containing protein n=1 Tax=Aphanomyces astaci TaxID=112090 RepID=A0A418CR50_APHAT|nr:hypothetical protein DYB35_001322 [Aphanomyces astaci]RHZ28353.1 hypothetical protein DYB37_002473 [Aphanomyces astaci]